MDVAVTEFRSNLSAWLERARAGEDILVTERGVPIARVVGIKATPIIERLLREGVIGRPATASRPKATSIRRERASTSIAELVTDQRS